MKKILIITDLPVVPANAGNKARVWSLMRTLREMGHEVWFLGLGLKPEEEAQLRAAWGPCVHAVPHLRTRHVRPRLYAAKRWLLDRFIYAGYGSPKVDYWYWPHWDREVAAFAASHQFDVVIAEYVFFSGSLRHFGPSTLKIIDTHDVFTGRREKLKARNIKNFFRYLTDSKEEARGLRRADAVIAIQHHEEAFFRSLVPDSCSVLTVGHLLDLPAEPLPAPELGTALFIGSDYSANVDGFNSFVEGCLPEIVAAIPNFRLLVAGGICRKVRSESSNVALLGEVKSLAEVYGRASVVINPVLTGTGLKTKSVEALAFGRPLVTTACGAEGIEEGAGAAFLQSQPGSDFANAVIRLLKNQDLAARLSKGAADFAREWNVKQANNLSALLQDKGVTNVR